jgi:hypothetical protein
MYMARANQWVRSALTPRIARTRTMLRNVSPIEGKTGARDSGFVTRDPRIRSGDSGRTFEIRA